jgi:hypothetical protein
MDPSDAGIRSSLPDNYMPTARIVIEKGLSPIGTEDTAFRVEGMSTPEAIGHLTAILDRLRYQYTRAWANQPRSNGEDEHGQP